ncbi:MAG: UDP-glucuronic acid decarboxylase family protein [Candidatus Anammoxibacter sp.]
MKIVITGGTGFLGSHICDFLLENGNSVICIDNLITGNINNIAHLCDNKDFKFIKHNVSEYIYLSEKIDAVLHFASPASPTDYLNYPIQTLKVGSLGTLNALGLAKSKCAKFLLASTSEVYGDPKISPQTEDYWGHVNPVGPRGVYDEAKRFSEAMTMAYFRYHKVDTKIVRIFNTYGTRMRLNDGRAVPNFVTQALRDDNITVYGTGKQTRSFCYVSDLVKGIYKLLESDHHEPVNIGNPEELTVLGLAKEIIKITGSKSKIVYKELPTDDPKVRRPDISKAIDLLDWSPTIGILEGLQKTIEYFKETIKQ